MSGGYTDKQTNERKFVETRIDWIEGRGSAVRRLSDADYIWVPDYLSDHKGARVIFQDWIEQGPGKCFFAFFSTGSIETTVVSISISPNSDAYASTIEDLFVGKTPI